MRRARRSHYLGGVSVAMENARLLGGVFRKLHSGELMEPCCPHCAGVKGSTFSWETVDVSYYVSHVLFIKREQNFLTHSTYCNYGNFMTGSCTVGIGDYRVSYF